METNASVVIQTDPKGRGGCGGVTRLPVGKQWLPHAGLRQRLRTFRQTWAQFEKLCKKKNYAAVTRERLLDVVVEMAGPKDSPEIMAMMLTLTAKVAAIDGGSHPDTASGDFALEWITALNKVLNEAEAKADEGKTECPKSGRQLEM